MNREEEAKEEEERNKIRRKVQWIKTIVIIVLPEACILRPKQKVKTIGKAFSVFTMHFSGSFFHLVLFRSELNDFIFIFLPPFPYVPVHEAKAIGFFLQTIVAIVE